MRAATLKLRVFEMNRQIPVDCLVFYAAFNNLPVISRRFLDKLPVQLVHLSWKHEASRNANPATLSAKEGSYYYHV